MMHDHTLQQVLDAVGPRPLYSVTGDASVGQAVSLMYRKHIGCTPVMEHGVVLGMFTERDVLCRVVEARRDPDTTPVRDVMSAPVVFGRLDTTVAEMMSRMTEARVRHVPILDTGTVAGLLSQGDLIKWLLTRLEHHVSDLTGLIAGPYASTPPLSLPPLRLPPPDFGSLPQADLYFDGFGG